MFKRKKIQIEWPDTTFEKYLDDVLYYLQTHKDSREFRDAIFRNLNIPQKLQNNIDWQLDKSGHIIKQTVDNRVVYEISPAGCLFILQDTYSELRKRRFIQDSLDASNVLKLKQELRLNRRNLWFGWIPLVISILAIILTCINTCKVSDKEMQTNTTKNAYHNCDSSKYKLPLK